MVDVLGGYFVAPIVATVLAVVFLRERPTARKIVSVLVGFGGTVLVLGPGDSLNTGMILAVGSGCLMGGYMVATRLTAGSQPFATLVIQYALGTLLLTPFAVFEWGELTKQAFVLVALMGGLSAVSQFLLINAFRFAQASTLSPLFYFELVASTIVGFMVFHDFPSLRTWVGIAIIVGGGLMLIQRQKGLSQSKSAYQK